MILALILASRIESYAWYGGLHTGDLISTQYALSHGRQEVGLVKPLGGRLALKAALIPLSAEIDHHMMKRNKPLAWLLRGLVAGGYSYVILRNTRRP